ncbi:uncharacterized protein LOC126372406 [Pectinophora gossypiella]|uniref:uncharacterized protein LOC126372406 n=1 Tax=Pectinophora gossypiella TaxID=13191 RepID=UPI00214F1E9C|nr:uncharacterized protein LOC126372406 [Pectinophora gossypiella]
MEAVEEPPMQNLVESAKVNIVSTGEPVLLADSSLCHTSNGVAESPLVTAGADFSVSSSVVTTTEVPPDTVSASQTPDVDTTVVEASTAAPTTDIAASFPPEEELLVEMEATNAIENLLDNKTEEITEEVIETSEAILCSEVAIEGNTILVDNVDTSIDKVTLRTEILVEKSDNDGIPDPNDSATEHDNSNNILSQLGQGIELSEALRSSDTTDNGENNNGTGREEVFNKEELLDILEGNDEVPSNNEVGEMLQIDDPQVKKMIEAQIALKQLTRLKSTRSKNRSSVEPKSSDRKSSSPRKRKGGKSEKNDSEQAKENNNVQDNKNDTVETVETERADSNDCDKKNDSIVNVLVKDWDDDEEADHSSQLLSETSSLLSTTDQLIQSQESLTSGDGPATRKSTDCPQGEGQVVSQNKSGDEGQPQRRLGRVIKKKVIFDPDNPDTFTKGKVAAKTKDPQTEKEQPPPKKPKAEPSPRRSTSKSPTSKLQWKKPTPKNTSKQNKRLTEIDRLLMDEGAVNMIYQLTPEAPKGKKNMRTKAEFIKKIQSSTPDSKEMKFRERKKEIKLEEAEAKKILGGKQRSSLSSSVKSPACEDFEAHSADDSIIYRRHSSSSYSSACMSPRRLSDVDPSAVQSAARAALAAENENLLIAKNIDRGTDVFMADAIITSNEIINKEDCLSLKEKLNTKLSLAISKRKRDSSKTDKPSKQKRVSKNSSVDKDSAVKAEKNDNFKYLTISFDQRLAEICIRKSGSGLNVEMLKEIEQALLLIDNNKEISVTLLNSECGTLCSQLDLQPLLGDAMETRTNYAHEMAESVRSLLSSVERHRKLTVSSVWGECGGVALALVALSDVGLAAENATFALSVAPPLPGVAALTTRCARLSQSLITDLVVFGRRLSAAEALQGGLVSRCVAGAPTEAARALAKDFAAQPIQSVLLKKQLLNLKKNSESESTFLSGLERERDLLVEYWTSVEGQEVLRAALTT